MKKADKNNVMKNIFLTLTVMCWIGFACIAILMIELFNVWLVVLEVVLFTLFIICWWLARLKYLGYQLKYYFSNKKYNQEIVNVIKKFEGAPQEFIDKLKRDTKRTYRYAGYLFSRDTLDKIYKDKKSKQIITDLYTKLYNSILSKGGFIEFFEQIESLNIDSWELNEYICNKLISDELDYLLTQVYWLTDYTIYDNKISEDFTKRNNKMIEDINNIYSPLLFNFKNEVEDVLEKLKNI